MQHQSPSRRCARWVVAGMVAVLVSAAPGPESPGVDELQAQEPDAEPRDCDRYVEAYARSAARKLGRALDRDDYRLVEIGVESPFEVDGAYVGRDEPVEFEVLDEEDGAIAGLVDRTRQFEYTYVVAEASFGPIVVSHAWQPRHLRIHQGCEPIASAVEVPDRIASTIDVEPFRYWGLRASWRIPSPAQAEGTDRALEEVLVEVMRDNAGVPADGAGSVVNDD